MKRDEVIALIDERIAAWVAEGKTCSTVAQKIEHARFLAAQEANAIASELAERASEAPIPPYTAITVSPTSKRSRIKTAALYEIGPNGYRLQVGGGFEIAKDGHASRIELPTAEVSAWRAGADPEFAALVKSGELVLTPMSEAEARPIELLARRFRKAGAVTAMTNAGPVGLGGFGGPKSGVFHG